MKNNKSFAYKFFTTASEAWDAMYQAILNAQKSIYWEIYSIENDEIGAKFIDLLAEKAKQGLEVKLIVDHIGSFSLTVLQKERLRESGVDLLIFNELFNFRFNIFSWFRNIWQRNHRKVLVIDEEIGFIGGVNIMAKSKNWYDLHLQLKGKVVRSLVRQFAKSYVKSGGEKKKIKHLFHPIKYKEYPSWKKKIKFIFHAPMYNQDKSYLKNLYYKLISSAKQSITLLTPYYLPDKKFLQLISEARKRRVEINIILPYRTDHKLVQLASQAFYELTQKAGAKLYFLNKMHHGKALLIDKKLGYIGSNNFTHRSFHINKEADILFEEKQMVEELNNIFENLKNQAISYNQHDKKFSDYFLVKKLKQWWANKIKKIV